MEIGEYSGNELATVSDVKNDSSWKFQIGSWWIARLEDGTVKGKGYHYGITNEVGQTLGHKVVIIYGKN